MDINEYLEYVFILGKDGNDEIYNELSRKSKEELKDYEKREIVESIQRFLQNKIIPLVNSEPKAEINTLKILIPDLRTKIDYEVIFVKENYSWKLLWNEKMFKEYR